MRPIRLAVLLALPLACGTARAGAVPEPSPPAAQARQAPTPEEVLLNTRPLIRARLRLPDSLQGLQVTRIEPTAEDPTRFVVSLAFQGRTPFGRLSSHQARFHMKRSATHGLWVVTAD